MSLPIHIPLFNPVIVNLLIASLTAKIDTGTQTFQLLLRIFLTLFCSSNNSFMNKGKGIYFVLHYIRFQLLNLMLCNTREKLSIYLSIYPSIHPSIYLSIYLSIYSPLFDHGRFFSFLIFYTVGMTPWTGDQPIARPLPAHTGQHKHRIYSHRHPCIK
jgi:hypothetical protein